MHAYGLLHLFGNYINTPLVDVIVSIANPELREKYPGRIIYYLPSLIFATIAIYLLSIYLTVTTGKYLALYIY